MNKRETIYWLMMLPALIFLLVFMVVPIVFIIQQSLISEAGAFSFERYAQILTSARDWKAIGLTIGVALLVTGFCELLAYPVAYLMARTKSRSWKTVFYIILVSPLLTSVVIPVFCLDCTADTERNYQYDSDRGGCDGKTADPALEFKSSHSGIRTGVASICSHASFFRV